MLLVLHQIFLIYSSLTARFTFMGIEEFSSFKSSYKTMLSLAYFDVRRAIAMISLNENFFVSLLFLILFYSFHLQIVAMLIMILKVSNRERKTKKLSFEDFLNYFISKNRPYILD
ncbi:MAG: hypothetical protein MHPSP_004624, partial [Paramarteilia canceri]